MFCRVARQVGLVTLKQHKCSVMSWVKTMSDRKGIKMPKTTPEQNKALVLEAFDTLFNKRDYAAAERFWSPDYIQHSAHIASGRDGLFNLIKSIPPTLKYEPGTIVAEVDFVIVHGRFSGFGAPANWIAADIVRIQGGILVEHWDVIQDEATEEQSISKRLSRPCSELHTRRTYKTNEFRRVGLRMTTAHSQADPCIEPESSLPSEVAAISPFVDGLMLLFRKCGCIPEGESGVEIALREALANAIIHGNHENPRKHVYVRCRCEPSEISIAVKDEGRGFDVN
jgi:predicted SnoaL-like aldol condensation-catalyzing enzyme